MWEVIIQIFPTWILFFYKFQLPGSLPLFNSLYLLVKPGVTLFLYCHILRTKFEVIPTYAAKFVCLAKYIKLWVWGGMFSGLAMTQKALSSFYKERCAMKRQQSKCSELKRDSATFKSCSELLTQYFTKSSFRI
jgi:hypothetical protein